jgi:hypothetical protein
MICNDYGLDFMEWLAIANVTLIRYHRHAKRMMVEIMLVEALGLQRQSRYKKDEK